MIKDAVEAFTEALDTWLNDTIPPITDPLGKHWTQPETSEILIDQTHAVMTRQTFDKLLEYSATLPTGAYPGKMWKRHDGVFDYGFMSRGGKPFWMLAWYGYANYPKQTKDYVSNNFREILIVD